MTRMILHRLLIAVIRLGIAAAFLILLVEVGYVLLGGADRHVWDLSSYQDHSAGAEIVVTGWGDKWKSASTHTLLVLALAYGGALLVGYIWGVLAARWRRMGGKYLLSALFSAFAAVPPFWFAIAVAIFSYFSWQRPGFADDWVVDQGPDVLSWWNAAVVALPAMAAATGWQIRAVAEVLEKEAGLPYVRGLFYSGYSDENIFYGNVFRRSLPDLVALIDSTLPFLLGCIIYVEWAFRYAGIGRLFVEGVRQGIYEDILMGGVWMAIVVCIARFCREVIAGLLKKS